MTIKVMAALLSLATVIATMAAVIFYMKAYVIFGVCMTVVAFLSFFLSVLCFVKDAEN